MTDNDFLDYQVALRINAPVDPAAWKYDPAIPDASYDLACAAAKWLQWTLEWLSGHPEHERKVCGIEPLYYSSDLTTARAAADSIPLPYSSGMSAYDIACMIRDS